MPPGSDTRRLIADIPVSRPSYMHSFALTERFLILTEIPFTYDLLKIKLRDSSLMDTMRWEPDRGTTFIVIDRASGEVVTRAHTDAFFSFHHANAFEQDGQIVVDLVAWADPTPLWALLPERLQDPEQPLANLYGKLERFEIPLGGGAPTRTRLADERVEFPRINYRHNGQPYRYAYAAAWASPASEWFDAIVRFDVHERTTKSWTAAGYPGEPIFVAAPDAQDEDDGILLVVVYNADTDTSSLVVLDAATLTELGRAQAPQRLPYNFHQDFFRAR